MTRNRRLELHETDRLPWDGLILGWGAMLPLAGLALWAWAGDAALAQRAAHLWSAALILFLAGVRRGLSFRTVGGPRPRQMLGALLLFAAGLVMLLMPADRGLVLGVVTFGLLAAEDRRAALRGEAPLYFARLRPAQMGFAAVMAALCRVAG